MTDEEMKNSLERHKLWQSGFDAGFKAGYKSPRDWTPCAEGLPEENGTYLVFAPSYRGGSSSGLDVINGIMFSRFKSGKWSIEHGYYNRPNCVIAWQPLPDPYNTDHMRDTTKKVDQFREPTKMMED